MNVFTMRRFAVYRLAMGAFTIFALASANPGATRDATNAGLLEEQSDASLLQDLLSANRQFVSAARQKDLHRLGSLTTTNYTAIDPYFAYMLTGEDVLKEEIVAWSDYFRPGNGDEILVRHESQPIVKRYGDIALLLYVELEAVKTRAQRVRAGRTAKCTFIYRLQKGKWILANSHITPQAWPDQRLIGRARGDAAEQAALASVGRLQAREKTRESQSEQDVLRQILAQSEKLYAAKRGADAKQWASVLMDDYTEFDPYYPFLLHAPKEILIEIQHAWDEFDRLTYGFGSGRAQRIQIFGNVAILTTTNIAKGQLVSGGFMDEAKSTLVYVKSGDTWLLSHTHDGRRAGPDGIPID